MKLCLWLYSHRHGVDVLKILTEDDVELSTADVVDATGIDWEGPLLDRELPALDPDDENYEEPRDVRDDEFLEDDVELPIGDVIPDGLLAYVSAWKLRD